MCLKVILCQRWKNHVDELQYETDILLKILRLLTGLSTWCFAADNINYVFCLARTTGPLAIYSLPVICLIHFTQHMITSFESAPTGPCWELYHTASRPKTSCTRLWRPRSVTCCSSTSTTRPISGRTTASVSLYWGNYLSSWPVSNCIMMYLHQLFCELSTSGLHWTKNIKVKLPIKFHCVNCDGYFGGHCDIDVTCTQTLTTTLAPTVANFYI